MRTTKLLHFVSLFAITSITACTCNRVQPNFEGVLMQNYGRNGESDFKVVTGAQGILGPGTELYQVPMWEQKADPSQVGVTAKDGGYFSVDPTFTYQPIRGSGAKIIFNYKHLGVDDVNQMMDNIENGILNSLVLNAYREEARNYTTDSLLNHLNDFEMTVEKRLMDEFMKKHFTITSLTSGLKPPESMVQAIEKRNNAIQEANEVKNQLEKSKMLLEKAKIDAEANRITAQGLEPRILQQQWIEAIRTTQNKVIITDGKTPVILGNP